MGIGTYGRTFTLRDPTPCAFGVAAIGAGQPGPYTGEAGFLGYNEVHHTNYPTLSQKLQINHKK
jgi:chitinase